MLGPRALSSVAVVVVGVVPALFGPWGTALAFAALGIVALSELRAMLRRVDMVVLPIITLLILVVTLVAVVASWPTWVFAGIASITLIAPAGVLIVRPALDGALGSWLGTVFASVYLAVPLAHLVAVRQIAGHTTGAGAWLTRIESGLGAGATALGFGWFLLAIVTTWLADVFAYAAGRSFGRHLMTPMLSPKKTWEGFAGGVAGAVVTAGVANWIFGVGMRPIVALTVGALIAVVATVGDLSESLLKRQTGVKDTGTLIPGHGGVLDRMDSVLFVFMVVYYVARVVTAV